MIKTTNQVNVSYARETWVYRDGQLWWRKKKQGRRLDRPCGSVGPEGYRKMAHSRFDKKTWYMAHVLVWNYHNGNVPEGFNLDHINRNRSDNRIENLRLSNDSMQQFNTKVRTGSSSGVTGVYRDARRGKWAANLTIHGVRHYLGAFATIDEAKHARKAKELACKL